MIWTCVLKENIVNQYGMQRIVFTSKDRAGVITMVIGVAPEHEFVVGQEYEFPLIQNK